MHIDGAASGPSPIERSILTAKDEWTTSNGFGGFEIPISNLLTFKTWLPLSPFDGCAKVGTKVIKAKCQFPHFSCRKHLHKHEKLLGASKNCSIHWIFSRTF